jgi:hypothetical protein
MTISLFVTSVSYADDSNNSVKIAKVIVPRAVVYADENLLSPLGYIGNGKLIPVGNPRKVNKDIVPIVISGRLAYLEQTDIEYVEERIETKSEKYGKILENNKEHNIDIILMKPEEKLNENNSILLQFGGFQGGLEIKNTMYNLENSESSWINSINATFLHRKPYSKYFYGVGFEYDYINAGSTSLKFFFMQPQIGYTLTKNPIFSLDLFGGVDFTTGTNTAVDANHADDPTGFIWGPNLGVRIIAAPTFKYQIFGALNYRKLKAYGFEKFTRGDVNNPWGDSEVTGFSGMTGIGFLFGINLNI